MKKSLMNKFTLKVLSLALAILIWLLVMNIQDPVVERSFYDIPVVIKNESYLASNLEIPLLIEGKDTVSVRVKGNRSVLDEISRENFTAEADMLQIVSMDTTPRMVPVKVTCIGIEDKDITVTPGNIPVDIEQQVSVDKTIAVNTGEAAPDKNYEIGSIKAIPEKVTISGPASIVNKIDKVVAKIGESDLKENNAEVSKELVIYDKNQDELKEKQMSYLDLKDVADNRVKIQTQLWRVQQNIKIKASYSGNPKYGYEVSSVSMIPDTVSIAGTEDALKKLAEQGNTLTIPAERIDVSGKSSDFEVNVDISELLPENTKLARDINPSVIFTVKILPYNSREYEVSAADISIQGKPENMDIAFEREKITVRIRAKGEYLDSLKPEGIKMKVNLKDYKTGEYEVPVDVTLPKGYELVDKIKIKVKLVPAAEK